jgi:two-component sensor histidine kinase
MMVIISLLQIQAQRLDNPKISTVLQESQNRIHAMMAIYEKLYRATDLTHIGLAEYFSELAESLFAAYNVRPGTIELETAISDIALDIDQTIPCGLIINELVNNTLKYAFPGDRKGRIRIEFGEITAGCRGAKFCAQTEKLNSPPMYALTVANNGVQLPAGFDSSKSSGFGLQLITMLAGQLGGKLQAHSREWTEFTITFPGNQSQQGGADE